MSRHDSSHGQDARATRVAPIDPLGPANSSRRWKTSTRSRYVFSETALVFTDECSVAHQDERNSTLHGVCG